MISLLGKTTQSRKNSFIALGLTVSLIMGSLSFPVFAAQTAGEAAADDPVTEAGAAEEFSEDFAEGPAESTTSYPFFEENTGVSEEGEIFTEETGSSEEGDIFTEETGASEEGGIFTEEAGASSEDGLTSAEGDPAWEDPNGTGNPDGAGITDGTQIPFGTEGASGAEDPFGMENTEDQALPSDCLITFYANGGGYFSDFSGNGEQYTAYSETVQAGTLIGGSADAEVFSMTESIGPAGGDFSASADSISPAGGQFSVFEEEAAPVYNIGPAGLYAFDGYRFAGWSLQEDGSELIPVEGVTALDGLALFAVWLEPETGGENQQSDEAAAEGSRTEAEGTDPLYGENGTAPEAGQEITAGEGDAGGEAAAWTVPEAGDTQENIGNEVEGTDGVWQESSQESSDEGTDAEGEALQEAGGQDAEGEALQEAGGQDVEGEALQGADGQDAGAETQNDAVTDTWEDAGTDAAVEAGTDISEDFEPENPEKTLEDTVEEADTNRIPDSDAITPGIGDRGSPGVQAVTGNAGDRDTVISEDEEADAEVREDARASSGDSASRTEEKQVKYKVIFDANGGSIDGKPVSTGFFEKGDRIDLNDYEALRSNYRFKGWSLKKNDSASVRKGTYYVTEEVTFYALWTEIRTVTFNANGGYFGKVRSSSYKKSFELGKTIDLGDYVPKIDGLEEFRGWSLTRGGRLLSSSYTVTRSITLYAVWAADIRDAKISLSNDRYTYCGKARTPVVTVKYGGRTLKKGTDYTVTYSNNIKAGKASVKITGKGMYERSRTVRFTIVKAAQKLTLKAGSARIAAGKTTTVKAGGAKETNRYKYKSSNTSTATVSSAGKVTAKKVGTVKITVSTPATADYKAGSKSVVIKVVPGAAKTMKAVNQQNGILISWSRVTGASGYLLYRNGKKIAAISRGTTVSYLDKNANANGKKYIYKLVATASTGTSPLSRSVSVYRTTAGSGSGNTSSGSSGTGTSPGAASGSSSGSQGQTSTGSGLPHMNTRYCLETDYVQTTLKNCKKNDLAVIDLDGVSQSVISEARGRGVQIYGYINAGALEQERSYYSKFSGLRLAKYQGWAGEYWVDITDLNWKAHLIEEARKIKAAGATGVYFDNADILYMIEEGFAEENASLMRTKPSAGNVYKALCDVVLAIENVGLVVMPNGGDTFVQRFDVQYPGVLKTVNQEGVLYDNNRKQPESERRYMTSYLDWCKNRGIYIRGIEYIDTTSGAEEAIAYYGQHGWDELYISRHKNLMGD